MMRSYDIIDGKNGRMVDSWDLFPFLQVFTSLKSCYIGL